MKFKSDIEVQAGLKDSSGAIGSSGQVLSSTGSNVSWVNPSASASGTVNYVSKFTGTTTLGNSLIYDNGTNVGIGTTTPTEKLHVSGGNIIVNTDQAIGWGDRTTQIVGVTGPGGIMRFDVNNAEKMRINATGNVGIGISSPNALLDVNGASRFRDSVSFGSTEGLISWGGNRFVMTSNGVNDMTFATDYFTDRLTIKQGTGNVGIGTISPAYKLDVVGGINTTTNSVIAGTFSFINLESNSSKLNCSRFLAIQQTGSVGIGYNSDSIPVSAKFLVNGDSYFNGTLLATGNVGIGNTSPAYKLDVTGGTRSAEFIFPQVNFNPSATPRSTTNPMSIKMWNNYFNGTGLGSDYGTVLEYYSLDSHVDSQVYFDAAGGSWYRTSSYASGWQGWQKYITSSDISGTTNYIPKFTSANTLGNSQLFDNGTNVGIGTASPTSILHVVGSGNPTITLGGSAGAYSSILELQSAGAGQSYIGATTSLNLSTNGAERMLITSTGNVGIGTSSPAGKLHIAATSGVPSPGAIALAIRDSGSPTFGFNFNLEGVSTGDLSLTRVVSGVQSQVMTFSRGDGNVGIGTTSPAYKLHVNTTDASANVIGVTNGTQILALGVNNSSGGSFLFENSNSALRFGTNGSERIRITAAGNVGIGTTSPDPFKLAVSGTIGVLGTVGSTLGSYYIDHPGVQSWKIGVSTANSSTLSIGNDVGGAFVNKIINLTNSGNVGIGATSPSAKLEIQDAALDYSSALFNSQIITTSTQLIDRGGSLAFGGQTGASATQFGAVRGAKENSTSAQTGGYLSFMTRANGGPITDKMRVTSAGSLLLGDTIQPSNPWRGTAVFGINGSSKVIIGNLNSSYTGATIGGHNSALSAWDDLNIVGGNVIFRVNETEKMRLNVSGNLGIGTSVPSYKVTISDNPRNTDVLCVASNQINADGAQSYVGISLQDDYANGGGNVSAIRSYSNLYSQWGSTLTFSTTGTGGSGVLERMIISNTGNVGIGTSPVYKLDVNGTSNINGGLYASGNVGIGTTMPTTQLEVVNTMSNPTLRLAYQPMSGYGGGGNIDFVGGYSDYVSGAISWKNGMTVQGQVDYTGFNRTMTLTSQQVIAFRTSLMERMRIDSTGQVGIGTSLPMYTLHVNGSVAGTSAYVNLSDERYKKDILPIENALDKVLSLNGVTFNWDKQFNPGTKLDDANHIGLIAQEVEKVIPQAVSTGKDGNQTKSVAYTDLVPVLIEAIKELKLEIEDLKKLINK
jgi:hypothetical protein